MFAPRHWPTSSKFFHVDKGIQSMFVYVCPISGAVGSRIPTYGPAIDTGRRGIKTGWI